MVPNRIVLTTGIGRHAAERVAYQLALRDAGFATVTLISLGGAVWRNDCDVLLLAENSIFVHEQCQLVHAVLAYQATYLDGSWACAAIGASRGHEFPGYISEVHELQQGDHLDAAKAGLQTKHKAELLARTTCRALFDEDLDDEPIGMSAAAPGQDGFCTVAIAVALLLRGRPDEAPPPVSS